jgi:hypothetical protein
MKATLLLLLAVAALFAATTEAVSLPLDNVIADPAVLEPAAKAAANPAKVTARADGQRSHTRILSRGNMG